jgi:hypothetical protein
LGWAVFFGNPEDVDDVVAGVLLAATLLLAAALLLSVWADAVVLGCHTRT